MFLNNFNDDLLFVIGSLIFIVEGITLSKYNNFTTVNDDSLITNPNIADSTGLVTSLIESSYLDYLEAS
jgi:hypothetical protein